MQRRVVVTGMGAVTPLGIGVETFWNNLIAGQSGAGPITHINAEKFKTRFACEVKGFDPQAVLDRKIINVTDRFSQFALVATDEALTQSGVISDSLDLDRVGVIWGSGNGGISTLEQQILEYAAGDGTPRFSPFLVPKMIVDITSGLISIKYGFGGPSFAPVSACATSTTAIIEAALYVSVGLCDVVVAGGSEAAITASAVGGFSSSKALSQRNDDPQRASRPFDIHRDGFVMGEGAGALIVESYEHAVARGATIIAEIYGFAQTSDAYHMTATHPEGKGAANGMRLALKQGNLQPSDIQHINAHATSTPKGDVSEAFAMHSVFAGCDVAVTATKSMTGHLLGAAGAVEAIATIKATVHDVVPPTINLEHRDPELPADLHIVANVAEKKTVNMAMSNTFGFGGHNAIVVVGKPGFHA